MEVFIATGVTVGKVEVTYNAIKSTARSYCNRKRYKPFFLRKCRRDGMTSIRESTCFRIPKDWLPGAGQLGLSWLSLGLFTGNLA